MPTSGGSRDFILSTTHKRTIRRDDSCQPEHGSTYLTVGQDLFSISEYIESQNNYSLYHSKEARELVCLYKVRFFSVLHMTKNTHFYIF
jgi:hypothetical protein